MAVDRLALHEGTVCAPTMITDPGPKSTTTCPFRCWESIRRVARRWRAATGTTSEGPPGVFGPPDRIHRVPAIERITGAPVPRCIPARPPGRGRPPPPRRRAREDVADGSGVGFLPAVDDEYLTGLQPVDGLLLMIPDMVSSAKLSGSSTVSVREAARRLEAEATSTSSATSGPGRIF